MPTTWKLNTEAVFCAHTSCCCRHLIFAWRKRVTLKIYFGFLRGQSWNFIFWFRILSGQNFLTQSSGENILSGQNLEKLPFPSQKFVGIPLIFTPKLKVLCIVDIFSQSVSLTECVVFCVCLSVRLSVPVSFLVVKQCFC